jgi:hypothetical protein
VWEFNLDGFNGFNDLGDETSIINTNAMKKYEAIRGCKINIVKKV